MVMVAAQGRRVAVWTACRLGWLVATSAAMAQPDKAPAARQPPPPVADFFRPDAMANPKLSPSGKHLAVHVAGPAGRLQLAVLNVDPPRQAVIVAGFNDTDIGEFSWANDERLVFNVTDRGEAVADRRDGGLYAVDRDGRALRMLVSRAWNMLTEPTAVARVAELTPNHQLLSLLRDGSADVMVQRTNYDASWQKPTDSNLMRLDTRSGRARLVDTGWTEGADAWRADAQGRALALWRRQGDQGELWWRSQPERDWVLLDRGPLYALRDDNIADLRVGSDGSVFAESVGDPATGTTALFRIDAATGKREAEPLVRVAGFDFTGQLLFSLGDKSLLGVRYLSDAWATAWLSADMQAVQQRVDAKLPGLVNLVDVAECGCGRWMVVTSFSDRQPKVFWLYDREADRLEPVGKAQPQIDARRMARRDFSHFKARDGLQIPVHLTRPAGKGPWPTVVLVHGGPHVRGGHWQWEADAQFLASRGYLVIEPEFRGSTGYGGRLFRAGWKQWGLKSQDDINDALAWAVAQGEADAGRACIAGASYGGYATLMGLIRDDALWRCGVAWMAVTDIGLMYDLHHSDLPDVWRQHGMPQLIGDPVKDAAQLAATSPLQQAGRLKRPLLMAAGGVDQRVPIAHGNRFKAALPDGYTGLRWLVYPDEGHGFGKPENLVNFWQQVETFLARELAPR
jgi:dipeptidyl aminopeptidase/acylaminoacyl peptidase